MFSWLSGLFRGRSILVQGVDQLPDGVGKVMSIGDPLAGGKQIVLCRVDGELFAVDRLCPHEGGRLVEGPLVEGRYVLCPLHNYKFDPKSGKARDVVCRSATTYKVVAQGNDCRIYI